MPFLSSFSTIECRLNAPQIDPTQFASREPAHNSVSFLIKTVPAFPGNLC